MESAPRLAILRRHGGGTKSGWRVPLTRERHVTLYSVVSLGGTVPFTLHNVFPQVGAVCRIICRMPRLGLLLFGSQPLGRLFHILGAWVAARLPAG
jgi:hypothetical protein